MLHLNTILIFSLICSALLFIVQPNVAKGYPINGVLAQNVIPFLPFDGSDISHTPWFGPEGFTAEYSNDDDMLNG